MSCLACANLQSTNDALANRVCTAVVLGTRFIYNVWMRC